MSRSAIRRSLRNNMFRVRPTPGQRRITKEKFTQQVFRDMLDVMRDPSILKNVGMTTIEAVCNKCKWPLNADQAEALQCPSCGKLAGPQDVAFRVE